MDWFDRRIVQFVLLWMPYGGPPEEDLLPQFGLSPLEFRRRFMMILTSRAPVDPTLSALDHDLLAKARRLASTGSGVMRPASRLAAEEVSAVSARSSSGNNSGAAFGGGCSD